jgi:hypothetical protein
VDLTKIVDSSFVALGTFDAFDLHHAECVLLRQLAMPLPLERDQDRDDRDHNEQFDERESQSPAGNTAVDGDTASGRRKASN